MSTLVRAAERHSRRTATGTGSTAAMSVMLRTGLDPNRSNEMPAGTNKYYEIT